MAGGLLPDFQFVPKANYYITHIRRLKDIAEPFVRFFPTLEPVRKRKQLGPVLFQLPPNFKADVPLLRDFLAQLPEICGSQWSLGTSRGSPMRPIAR